MTTTDNAFVKALRSDPDMPDSINPIGRLKTAIIGLQDLDTLVYAADEDPDAHGLMIDELIRLHAKLTAALAEHDAGTLAPKPAKVIDLPPEVLDPEEQLRRYILYGVTPVVLTGAQSQGGAPLAAPASTAVIGQSVVTESLQVDVEFNSVNQTDVTY